jgi:hypothetical protein
MGSSIRTERPKHGTVGSKVWTICDLLMETKGVAETDDVIKECADRFGIEAGSARANSSHWRIFNGFGRIAKVEQNGVKKPRPGTVGNAIWSWADEVRNKQGDDYKAIRVKLRSEAEAKGFLQTNVEVELSAWKRFYGEL